MVKIRVEYWVPVRYVTELSAAEVKAAMRSGYDPLKTKRHGTRHRCDRDEP